MLRFLTDHPHSVGESYGEHFRFAARFGARMMAGGAAALVHAVLPCFCATTASRRVRELHDTLHRSAVRQAKTPEHLAGQHSAGSGI
jgi:hypothetical protein